MGFTDITIWIVTVSLISFTTGQSDTREILICSDTKVDNTISCENGPLYIRSATVLTLKSWQFCDISQLGSELGNVPSGCKLNAKGVYEACHGKQSCSVQRWMTRIVLSPGQCENGETTNVLHITYSCFDVADDSATLLPLQDAMTGESFDIFSPLYPCKMPGEKYSLTCSITKNSTIAPVTMSLLVEIVQLSFGTSGHCWEDLTLSTTGSKTDLLQNYCSGEERELWRKKHFTNSITSLEISYSSKLDSQNEAGMFWIKVQNAMVGQKTLYRLSCTTEANINSSATSGCEPFKEDLVVNVDPGNKKSDPGSNTTTDGPSVDPPVTKPTSDDDDNDSSLAYGLTGFAIVVIIIIAIIASICAVRCTRKKKDKEIDREDTSMTNIHSVNGGTTVHSSEDETRNGKITEIEEYDDKKRKSRGSSHKDRNSVLVASAVHSSDRDSRSTRRDDDVEEIQRYSEAPEEERSRTHTPSVHERPTSYVSTADSNIDDRSTRPESDISEMRRESKEPDRSRTPSVLAVPAHMHGRPSSYHSEAGSSRPASNRDSVQPEETSRTHTPIVPPAPPVPPLDRPASRASSAAESGRLDDVVHAPQPQDEDLSSMKRESEVPDVDDTDLTPDPAYSSIQRNAAPEIERRDYTKLQHEDAEVDDINRSSRVSEVDRDSIDYEDTVHSASPRESEANRDSMYPNEQDSNGMYAAVDKSKKRASSAVYASDDTVDAPAYENVDMRGMKAEETVISDEGERNNDVLY